MAILFDDELHVHYSQFYIESRDDGTGEGVPEVLAGQRNGLCGAAVPGLLYLTTGLHTGSVHLTIEVLDAPVPAGEEWEDVVEVSFRPQSDVVVLEQWAGDGSWLLELDEIDYRVRYCASGMDRAREKDTRLDGEPLLDRYLLQLWPSAPAQDAVIRQTSDVAGRSNVRVRRRPAQRARAHRSERPSGPQVAPAAEADPPLRERLRRVRGGVAMLDVDHALVAELENLDETTLRAVAIWAARQACDEAGLSDLDWIAPALTALEGGEPLPPPLDDHDTAFARLRADTRAPRTAVGSYDGRDDRVSQQHMALPALRSAAADTPLAAALGALFHATTTFGNQYPRLLTELRQTFPALATRE